MISDFKAQNCCKCLSFCIIEYPALLKASSLAVSLLELSLVGNNCLSMCCGGGMLLALMKRRDAWLRGLRSRWDLNAQSHKDQQLQ